MSDNFPYGSEKELVEGEKYYEKAYSKLDDPKGGFSKMGLILDLVNQLRKTKQFFRISIPIFFISPISMLEFISLYFTPTPSLLKIASCKSAEQRFLRVTKWAMQNIPRMLSPDGFCHVKPYNPIIGERHIWKWKHKDGSVTRCIAEQVSHHPPISSFYLSNRKNNFSIRSTIYPLTKLHPNSFSLQMVGEINLRVHTTGEEFKLEFPPVVCYGILMGKQFVEHNGEYKLSCKKSKYNAFLLFKEKEKNKIVGRIVKANSEQPVYSLSGHADKKILIRQTKTKKVSLFCDNSKKTFLNIKQDLQPIAQQDPIESRRNWHMISKHLRDGDLDKAHTFKVGVENVQRKKRKERNEKGEKWVPKYFKLLREEEMQVEKEKKKIPLYECIYDNSSKYKDGESDVFEQLDLFKKF